MRLFCRYILTVLVWLQIGGWYLFFRKKGVSLLPVNLHALAASFPNAVLRELAFVFIVFNFNFSIRVLLSTAPWIEYWRLFGLKITVDAPPVFSHVYGFTRGWYVSFVRYTWGPVALLVGHNSCWSAPVYWTFAARLMDAFCWYVLQRDFRYPVVSE